MTGAAPPCSRAQRVPGASRERKVQPTAALPMKLKNPTRRSVTKGSASSRRVVTSACPHGAGSPASRKISKKAKQESGVSSAGLTMNGHPAANAGQTWWTIRLSGWLKALTATTTPTGSVWVNATRPCEAALRFMGTT